MSYLTSGPSVPLSNLNYNGQAPDTAALSYTEARLWLQFYCYFYGYEQAMRWNQVHETMIENHRDLLIKGSGDRELARIREKDIKAWAKEHFLTLQRHAMGDRRLMTSEAFAKHWLHLEELIRLGMIEAETNPDMIPKLTSTFKRMAQMLGYDAPRKVEITGGGGGALSAEEKRKAIDIGRWKEEFEANLLNDAIDAD